MTPKESNMPMKGGRPVSDLNKGTNNNDATPEKRIVLLCEWLFELIDVVNGMDELGRRKLMAINGMITDTIAGRNTSFMICIPLICPPIHNMVVVTSPIGDHAPPALAAITIMEAK